MQNTIQQTKTDCHPPPTLSKAQYIIGYGSLMNEISKRRTTKNVDDNLPVRLTGYQRIWNATANILGFSTTYLNVIPDKNSQINTVIYRLFDHDDILRTDKRERSYCRRKVHWNQIQMLSNSELDMGEIWIYVKETNTHLPSKTYPIIQSYVDTFLSGCFQMEEKFKLIDFAKDCVRSTQGWSQHWVNDRLYPRRPHLHQLSTKKINQLLNSELPEYFQSIRKK